ncbi:hypothetical protein Moror_17790 [Moniliophthora roreri MCA 2997]|uniref:BZIP domain-containing protein n=1 Tax=Moniliophthora roreri (strain MCA 2997) TaxID=1381753 RepID=V2Z066_MONRO|nr:hypothetical protein Moror_17790 [Moniliophthora roreri MCA 2997]
MDSDSVSSPTSPACPPTPPPLQMSQLLSADVILRSPGEEWGGAFQDTSYSQYHYHHFPPSPPISVAGSIPTDYPIQPSRMLKMRMSPDSSSNCLPTHQLFDLGEVQQAPQQRVSISIRPPSIPTAMKRSASPAAHHLPPTTKKRAIGERISTKDFVPPDVSGLSKREARLVKNRAAAFLSRQRKREEFEHMEARVQDLEQENARLLALTQHGIPPQSLPSAKPDPELCSEIESLRAQLAAARKRELQLSAQLSAQSSTTQGSPVKVESIEPTFSSSNPSSPRFPSVPNKSSAASLGLMVLLCALPTLLSMPTQSALPATFSLPAPAPMPSSASLGFNSYLPNDWSQNGNPLVEFTSGSSKDASGSATHRLEFSSDDSKLSGLDISFDTVPSEDGKIRVRIHSSSSASSAASGSGSSRATSPGSSIYSNADNTSPPSSTGLEVWDMHSVSSSYSDSAQDPFLGIGASHNDFSFSSQHHHHNPSALFGGHVGGDIDSYSQMSGSDYSFDYSPSHHDGSPSKRRVRIALKSMPSTPNEGGEWEIQVC